MQDGNDDFPDEVTLYRMERAVVGIMCYLWSFYIHQIWEKCSTPSRSARRSKKSRRERFIRRKAPHRFLCPGPPLSKKPEPQSPWTIPYFGQYYPCGILRSNSELEPEFHIYRSPQTWRKSFDVFLRSITSS